MEKIILGVIVVCVIYVIFAYNKMVGLKNYVKEAFSTMDVYLKKRWDLIPNLVECVKGYSNYEKSTLAEITNLRTKNYSSLSNDEKININEKLSASLGRLFAIAENYPELKASETYTKLMSELSKIEEDIANSRKYYNGTVREFNTVLELFPSNIIGMIFGFKQEKLFEISDEQKENVKVKF